MVQGHLHHLQVGAMPLLPQPHQVQEVLFRPHLRVRGALLHLLAGGEDLLHHHPWVVVHLLLLRLLLRVMFHHPRDPLLLLPWWEAEDPHLHLHPAQAFHHQVVVGVTCWALSGQEHLWRKRKQEVVVVVVVAGVVVAVTAVETC